MTLRDHNSIPCRPTCTANDVMSLTYACSESLLHTPVSQLPQVWFELGPNGLIPSRSLVVERHLSEGGCPGLAHRTAPNATEVRTAWLSHGDWGGGGGGGERCGSWGACERVRANALLF